MWGGADRLPRVDALQVLDEPVAHHPRGERRGRREPEQERGMGLLVWKYTAKRLSTSGVEIQCSISCEGNSTKSRGATTQAGALA